MKAFTTDDFSAFIGIDWADKKHDVCEFPANTNEDQFSVLPNKPQALHDWALSLKHRYSNKSIAVACELKKGNK